MSIGPVIVALILIVRALAYVANRSAYDGPATPRYTGRQVLWAVLLLAWIAGATWTLAAALAREPRFAAIGLPLASVGAAVLFFAFPILRALARRGHPRLVYRLAHLSLVFAIAGEAYSGACLLALLALAPRGGVTREELDFVRTRLAKETYHAGAFATASALLLLLEARVARSEGRHADAASLWEKGRTLLGTVTYVSERAVPRPALAIAYELLGLDDAGRGRWGTLELAPDQALTPVSKILRGWARERLMKQPPVPKIDRLRRRAASPVLDALFARRSEPEEAEPTDEQLWERARRDYVVLLRGGSTGPRRIINLLATFDVMLHPRFERTALPPEMRDDEEAVASIHDDVASALTGPLAREGAPLFAMKAYGPISARVYQNVETALLGEMERALDALDARMKHGDRLDATGEWLEASYVRAVYRKIQMTLGSDAGARVWPRFVFSYCGLGVDLSENEPRIRPLAYAIFNCLHGEAVRLEDEDNVRQQAHNMRVTREES